MKLTSKLGDKAQLELISGDGEAASDNQNVWLGGEPGFQLTVPLQRKLQVCETPSQQLAKGLLALPQIVVRPPALHQSV